MSVLLYLSLCVYLYIYIYLFIFWNVGLQVGIDWLGEKVETEQQAISTTQALRFNF